MALVVQAVLIANIIDRSLLHGATIERSPPSSSASQVPSWRVRPARLRRSLPPRVRHSPSPPPCAGAPAPDPRPRPVWLSGERAGELSATATRGIAALDVYFGRYLPQAVLAVLAPVGILVWVGWEDPVSLLILLDCSPSSPHHDPFRRAAAEQTARQWRSSGPSPPARSS